MSAININLTLEQGTDYDVEFTIKNDDGSPLNLTDYDAASIIRKTYTSVTSYPFQVTFVDRISGEIKISMGSSVTTTLKEGRYMYDVVLTSPNSKKSRVIQGNLLVTPGVTV
jgi:hypothetical protein